MKQQHYLVLVALIMMRLGVAVAQISPGDLAQAHAQLEGISNCTQCHSLGEKISNDKCLACHTEVKSRIDQRKGYHSSAEVAGKNCISCHSDHHGRKFELVHFEKEKFNHQLTGFALSGAHSKNACSDCHKREFIQSGNLKQKQFTYLGLGAECVSCHEDYHQNTLSSNCSNCHGDISFKPAVKFSHSKAKYQLTGKHLSVDCYKCHKLTTRDGKDIREFTGLKYANCSDCHSDPHKNQFGAICIKCHTTESFQSIKEANNFDHSQTGFKLEYKHAEVSCKACHIKKFTDPLKHNQCSDCHSDFHSGQFSMQGKISDCSKCHTVQGFGITLYTVEQHNQGSFRLGGAHLATPCISCHKKADKWNFRNLGNRCIDCHTDIHASMISTKYYPDSKCENCHSIESWNNPVFDHSLTNYSLTGSHSLVTCHSCHFRSVKDGTSSLEFKGLDKKCQSCHSDAHHGQFLENGQTDCGSCHTSPGFWTIGGFDHSNTAFRLDGQHAKVACSGCHKKISDGKNVYVLYKIKETKCENCH